MKKFAELLCAACVALLRWWQLDRHARPAPLTWALIAAGGVGAWLTCGSRRWGYVVLLFLGVGYLAEMILRFTAVQLDILQPLVGWAAALAVLAGTLLWSTREKQPQKPTYERHPHL